VHLRLPPVPHQLHPRRRHLCRRLAATHTHTTVSYPPVEERRQGGRDAPLADISWCHEARTAWSEGLHGVVHLEQRMDLGISGRCTRGSGGTREKRGERRGMALGFGGARVWEDLAQDLT
jgi:hypothetical protein